jgi:hypothetical protein
MDFSSKKASQLYRGSCHCGEVQFSFESPLDAPFRCGCSYCQSRGAVLHDVPERNVRLLRGEDFLISYGSHHFCKHCGVFAFTRPSKRTRITVNLRCVDALRASYLAPLPVDACS